jgi:pimeloyl-ACP methyl ester carboxylesterase
MSPALQAERAALRDKRLGERDPDAYQRRLFELSVTPYFVDPSLVRRLTSFRVIARTSRKCGPAWVTMTCGRGSPARLPALVLHGKEDVIPAWAAEEAAKLLHANGISCRPADHCPHVEQPAAFAEALNGFL